MKPGLSPSEWQQLREKERSYLEEAVTTVTPFTGISANVLAHLRDDWISWRDEFVQIIVPVEDSCNNYKMISGAGLSNDLPMYGHREEPCVYCRTKGETDGFENLNAYQRQSVQQEKLIVHREIASPAHEFIEKVFRTYDRPELGVSVCSVNEAARRVIDRSQGDFIYSKLKRTAPVLYAYYGLDCDEIDRLTTFKPSSIKKIVQRTPKVNFGNVTTAEFLRVIFEREPVTASELMDKLNLSRAPVYNRINNLKEEGKITVSNGGYGRPAATYSTTVQWNEPFRCSMCGFTSHSPTGIRTHREAMHDSTG
jgi:DNA-binding MarR family transcriptional regulator